MDDSKLPPIEFDENWMDDSPKVGIGMLDDPANFDIGVAPSLDNAIVIQFAGQQGAHDQALGFRGEAAKKLLRSMAALLNLISQGAREQEETPAPPKKKITLH